MRARMTCRTACIAASFLASAPLRAQQLMQESVKVQRPNPLAALGGRLLTLRHLKPYRTDSGGTYRFGAGDSIGAVEPYPERLSRHHDATIARADSLYNQHRYREAAALLEGAYREEPANPFIVNADARTLFQIDDQRDRSFELYSTLIASLDRQGGTNDSVVFVDLWFQEAYWKIASLYLDRGEYKSAAFEISRFLAAAAPRQIQARRQAMDFLVEAYFHLGEDEMVRLWAAQALRLDPTDAYALPFLYQMGPRATTRSPTDLRACRRTADALPLVGAYSFFRERDTLHCFVDRDDQDSTQAPCLRVGDAYVGEGRDEVERALGAPQQSFPQSSGALAYMYLVFHDVAQHRGAYYVIEYESLQGSEIIRSLQLTRDQPPLPLDFSCVRLGDRAEGLTQQIGPPVHTAPFDDPSVGIKGQRWTYGPVPLSVEIVDGKVYSIRVWRPDGLPLKRRHLKFGQPD